MSVIFHKPATKMGASHTPIAAKTPAVQYQPAPKSPGWHPTGQAHGATRSFPSKNVKVPMTRDEAVAKLKAKRAAEAAKAKADKPKRVRKPKAKPPTDTP